MKGYLLNKVLVMSVISICMSFATFLSQADEDPYGDKNMQDVLRQAFGHVQTYYPSGEICVSDSVYTFRWLEFGDIVDEDTYKKMERLHSKSSKENVTLSSNAIRKLFPKYVCPDCGAKYVAKFSAPSEGLIKCYVIQINREGITMYAPEERVFLFHYDDKGLFQINKRTLESEYEDYWIFSPIVVNSASE